ncbi:hypothetical protein LU11_gp094 [Pseudomonas phage Lu11]|uniref:hypothetical protein n=1 Tax=Pseudomonas phage Lu11 TaxID=1161927 RepID=UPI00025F1538|nr:hypothetical protein LU11_gp094 [Pseudomonas phage Lu11]AFH14625.1 hypothetical protein Lu11_0093 [Pseudomonas phage Lu11]
MIRRPDVSPIFSLADTFTHTVRQVDVFEEFGSAHDGYHIGLFFRPLVNTPMHIDYENPYELNRFCKMYNFVNARGSIYGHLFVVADASKADLSEHKLIVSCNKRESFDFEQMPVTSYKQKLLIFKTGTGSVLAISGHADSPYLVTES